MARTTRTVVGMLLKYARERCKISRKEFCEKTGLGYKALWDIERGARHISIKKLNEYIAVLGITEDEFWDMGLACLLKEKRKAKKNSVDVYKGEEVKMEVLPMGSN